jgi:putative transposase
MPPVINADGHAQRSAPRYRFGAHDRICIDGVDYAPRTSNEYGHIFVRVGPDDLTGSFTHARIQELLTSDRLIRFPDWYSQAQAKLRTVHGETRLSDLPDKEARKVLNRKQYCDAYLARKLQPMTSLSDASLDKIIDAVYLKICDAERTRQSDTGRCDTDVRIPNPPSATQLRRWLARYEEGGLDPLSLRDRRPHRSGNTTSRFDKDDFDSADLFLRFVRSYASEHQPSKALLYTDYKNAVAKMNEERTAECRPLLKLVSRRSLETAINRLDPFFVVAGREGIETALRKFALVQGGLDVTRPLKRIEIDEWKVNLHVLLVAAGLWATMSLEAKALVDRARLWLSLAIDTATKCILAMRFLVEPPNADSAIATLEMAVFDKSHLAAIAGVETPWDMCGTPECVVTDSGQWFLSPEFLCCVLDMKASSLRPPAGLPYLRGTVERVFGTCQSTILARFPGQTFENILRKGKYDTKGHAVLLPDELNRVFIRHVVDAYHNTPHAGLAGETPRSAWLRLTALYGHTVPPDLATRRHVFGVNLERRITNRGIRVLGLYYQNDALHRLRAEVGQKHVRVRFDRFDLGKISVRVEKGWMSVPAVFQDVAGTTYWEWIAAADDLRRQHASTAALAEPVVRRALETVQGTADMALARAELASPILTSAQIGKAEREHFRSFDFVRTGPDTTDEFLPDDVCEANVVGPSIDDAKRQTTDLSSYASDDEFGSEDDWLGKE